MSDESGNVVAHYEYSPFGSLAKVTGDYAGSNPFRFSSEYFDEEMGLVYYNYRYYNPELGRWISRDPIEEQGGMNLYAFIRNNSITIFDNLGFSEEWPWTGWDWLTWPIHVCFDFGAGLSHLGISFYNSINRMGNTDREKYHDDVMAGRANLTTQSPSTQKDMQIVGDTGVKSATSMPGTSINGPPPTSIIDIMSQAPAQAASESK